MSTVTNILVPLDFSDASHAALQYACRLADGLHASLHLLHVVEPAAVASGYMEVYVPSPELLERFEEEGHRLLHDALTAEERAKYRAVLAQRTGQPAAEILDYLAGHGRIDLIVMATHGRGGVARLLMGSVADRVVRSARCPVLTLRNPNESVRRADLAA
jgi:universal stress protein A